MMKECAPTCIICFIMKICAHVLHMFHHESMCSHMQHIVSLPKYVLTYIVCLIMEVCALCIVCFLVVMKGIHINMQTGVCQRFSCQNGGSGASQFIFGSTAVTYLVCSFSLLINNILWLTAVPHKSNSLIVWSECVLSLMAHTPCLHTFECDVKVRVK